MATVKCPNPMCLDGWVIKNVKGKNVRVKCTKCKGSGTIEKK